MLSYNFKQPEWVLGLMSGTSLDGVDAALLKTDGTQIAEYGPYEFLPYPDEFQSVLRQTCGQRGAEQCIIDELTEHHIQIARSLIQRSGIVPIAIGFHGQTIFHQSRQNGQKARTLQIGNPQRMANSIQIPIVFNFRQNDIDHGGEGAPFVPLFHAAMVHDVNVAVINIGGVSNVTLLNKQHITAGDVGAGCALINDWVQQHTKEGFDAKGHYALSGQARHSIVSKWMKHDFFKKPLPKSLDRNTFQVALNDIATLSLEDGAATLASFTVQGILHHTKNVQQLILCGGGRHNLSITRNLAEHKIIKNIDDLGVHGDFVEAYAFAYFAARSLQGMPLSIPHTTGVNKPVSGGILYFPQ